MSTLVGSEEQGIPPHPSWGGRPDYAGEVAVRTRIKNAKVKASGAPHLQVRLPHTGACPDLHRREGPQNKLKLLPQTTSINLVM